MSGSSREAQRRKTLGSCAELVITVHECRNECCARPINSLSVKSLERGDKEYNKKLLGA